MNNPSGKKLEKLVFGLFDQMIEGADKYITEQGSTWLIFTEDKRWVVEFTKDKTLWFNYNLFQNELDLVSKDCTQERDLIKNWFESRFLGIKPVEDTIQNGVRHTDYFEYTNNTLVEDTIQEGVKNTFKSRIDWTKQVEDDIQNGVKDTQCDERSYPEWVEETIQNGVRHTNLSVKVKSNQVEDTIQNGVKETKKSHWIKSIEAEDIIENGISDVKHSYDFEEIVVKDIIEDSYNHKGRVEGVIRNTVKDGI